MDRSSQSLGEYRVRCHLLPLSVYLKHPVGFTTEAGQNETYDHLRVVGVRFDPEKKQVRLVWQPVVWDRALKKVTTEDKAAHSFHQISEKQWPQVFQEWSALKQRSDRHKSKVSGPMPLSVHPRLQAQDVEFRSALNRFLQKLPERSQLIQLTAMQLMAADSTWWSFAGIHLASPSDSRSRDWAPIDIPMIQGSKVDFFNLTQSHQELRGQFNFFGDDGVPFAKVVRGYVDQRPETTQQYQAAKVSIVQAQNPHLTDDTKIDCASCHIAQPIQVWMKQRLPNLPNSPAVSRDTFQNPNVRQFNLSNTTFAAHSTRSMRALGYFEDRPAINQRVIHESADVADCLNRK